MKSTRRPLHDYFTQWKLALFWGVAIFGMGLLMQAHAPTRQEQKAVIDQLYDLTAPALVCQPRARPASR